MQALRRSPAMTHVDGKIISINHRNFGVGISQHAGSE
jgi:hypothetical protein